MSTATPGQVIIDEPYGAPYTQSQTTTPTYKQELYQSDVDAYPFYIKWGIKIGTVFLGGLAMVLGILGLVLQFDIGCIFGGILLILGGLIVLMFEAPVLCMCLKCIEPVSVFSKKRAPWQKFIIYVIPGPIAMGICPEVETIFGGIALILVAALYLYFQVERMRK